MKYAEERKLFYMEMSAKTGKNVNEAFNMVVNEIYKSQNKKGDSTQN